MLLIALNQPLNEPLTQCTSAFRRRSGYRRAAKKQPGNRYDQKTKKGSLVHDSFSRLSALRTLAIA